MQQSGCSDFSAPLFGGAFSDWIGLGTVFSLRKLRLEGAVSTYMIAGVGAFVVDRGNNESTTIVACSAVAESSKLATVSELTLGQGAARFKRCAASMMHGGGPRLHDPADCNTL